MYILKETGMDRKGIDWLRSKGKLHKNKHKKTVLPNISRCRNCIAILSSGRRCKNKRVKGEVYCLDHCPKENLPLVTTYLIGYHNIP
jgi:hypothetical protein